MVGPLLLKPIRQTRRYPETRLQTAVVKHLQAAATPGTFWLHPENERKRTPQQANLAKAMGMLPGAADLLVFGKSFLGALEFKAGNNGQTSAQEAFQSLWEAIGGSYWVCRDVDTALELLREWGALRADFSYVPAKRLQMRLPEVA